MKLIRNKTWIYSILILAISFFGCEDDDDGGETLPTLVAGFTQTVQEATGVVTFINISENADSFAWDFGDGTTSTIIDPVKTYTTGTYTVRLTASNAAGASDVFSDEITISIPEAVMLPITFDGANVDYTAGTFSGASFEVVDNPAPGGSNDVASMVGAITNSGAAFEGISFDVGTPVDLSTNQSIQMDVWSESGLDVLLKFEQGTGADTEVTAAHTGSGWESLTFNFSSTDSFSRITIFIDGPGTTAGTFYIDNIEQVMTMGSDMPTEAAPTPPARDAGDVISLFSNAYTDITVDTFFAGFGMGGGVADAQVAGDDVKVYTDLDFTGIETLTENVDLSSMTNFHIDVWSATSLNFLAGVVDFGGDGFGSGNDTRGNTANTALTEGEWVSIDVTIADLQTAGLTDTPTDFSQLILEVIDAVGTIYVDNIYFYADGGGGGDMPTDPAPTPPARDAGDVVSVFSNAYTNVTVDTFFAGFGEGTGVADAQVSGDDVKVYADLNFAGIETLTETVDLSSMTTFHIDVWSATALNFLAGVVDFGGDGFGSGNDTRGDTPNTALTAGAWTSIDVTIADLQTAGLTATPTDFSQLILDVIDVTGTIYVDNIYFYKPPTSGGPMAPTTGAAAPTQDAGDVISIYSDTYTDVARDGLNFYGAATFEEVDLAGNSVLRYTFTSDPGGNFQVIELGGANQIDAATAGMTNFRFDVWFPNTLDASSEFLVKVVDFGTSTTEGLVNVNASSNPVIAQGQWLSFDVPFSELQSSGLAGTSNIQQIVIDLLNSGEAYVDNIYFYADSGGGTPTCPAPPTGELLSNGDFEANSGDGACWQLNDGGGTVTITDTDADTGTYSARMVTGQSLVPNLKQERFAPTIAGGQDVQVTFRYRVVAPFVDGAILQVLAFSERSGGVGAVASDLGNAADTNVAGNWLTYTGSFTTDAGVDEGISLLIQATCGGAATCAGEVLIDNVVVTEL
ncbi:MAG: PKD domain-containing protein [Bacteroidota bacterium]